MVGRDHELRGIEQALNLARTGRGGAVFVIGEGGIGKSRLAAEAGSRGYTAGMRMMRGRGSSIGPTAPFRPLKEALLSLLRSGEPVEVAELGPYRSILARLIPDWGAPAAWEPGGSLVVLAEAVLRLTALAGRDQGCLLVLDDMQDFDAETLAVVEYLADNLDRQPTLLLGTVRSGPSPALDLARSAAQRGSGTLVELRRLGQDDLRRLAASCLNCGPGDVPDEAVAQLWAGSAGIPLLAVELVRDMTAERLLVRDGPGWRVADQLPARVPATLARTLARPLDAISPEGRELLSLAAVLGPRFPVTVLQVATGLGDRDLLSHLHGASIGQLVAVDEETPDWYAFRHPMIRDAMLTLLTPAQRVRLARQGAAAVETAFPDLPGEWCQLAATLHAAAGEPARAGRLCAKAGRRALDQGAAQSAVSLLDQALGLLADGGDAGGRAGAFAALLYALAEAGLVERAVAAAGELEQMAGLLTRDERARLHVRLAWAAAVAGRTADGLGQVEIARRLLGPGARDVDTAPVDVVDAHLMLDLPGPDQVRESEALCRRAAEVADAAPLPIVACQAWQLLGSLTRTWDPEEATTCLERARRIAVRHDLHVEEIHALIRQGNDDALRHGSLDRLEHAQRQASQAGAVLSRYQAEASIALYLTLQGEFAAAGALLDQVLQFTGRMRLMETTRYALLVRAVRAAHQGRRRDMDTALAELRAAGGGLPLYAPRIHGLARAWCALLEEARPRAADELATAFAAEKASATFFQLTGRYGIDLLLRALDGTLAEAELVAVTALPASQLRWDRQFALFARAVLAGRAGETDTAAAAVADAQRVGAPYATGRRVGLRLVSEAALTDGWGEPVAWLRACHEYFDGVGVPAVAGACRALMRQAGAAVGQRRRGRSGIPRGLRTAGVTVREYEVLQLLTERLTNSEIADRLHLSTRTVEKHVASLLTKTGQPNRIALAQLGLAGQG